MRRKCLELFPHRRGLAIPTCITARAWRTCHYACRGRYLFGLVWFEVGGGENVPGIPSACTARHFTYLVRGPCGRCLSAKWHLNNTCCKCRVSETSFGGHIWICYRTRYKLLTKYQYISHNPSVPYPESRDSQAMKWSLKLQVAPKFWRCKMVNSKLRNISVQCVNTFICMHILSKCISDQCNFFVFRDTHFCVVQQNNISCWSLIYVVCIKSGIQLLLIAKLDQNMRLP